MYSERALPVTPPIPGFPEELFSSYRAKEGYSPLHVAAMEPVIPSAALDVLEGKPNKYKIPMVDWDTIVLRLLEHPKASDWLSHNMADDDGRPKGSPLALAVQCGHVRRTRILLSANPRAVNLPLAARETHIVEALLYGKYGYPRAEDWLPPGTVDKLGRNASDVLVMVLGAGVRIEAGKQAVQILRTALRVQNPLPFRTLLNARPELHEDLCLDKHGRNGVAGWLLEHFVEDMLAIAPDFGGIAAGWPMPPATESAVAASPHMREKDRSYVVAARGRGCETCLRWAATALEALRDYRGWTPQQLEEEVRRFLTDTKEKEKSFGRYKVGNIVASLHFGDRWHGSPPRDPIPFATEVITAAQKASPVFAPRKDLPLPTDDAEKAADEEEATADRDEAGEDERGEDEDREEEVKQSAGKKRAKLSEDEGSALASKLNSKQEAAKQERDKRAAAREVRASARLEREKAREARAEARRKRRDNLQYSLAIVELRLLPGFLEALTTHVVTALRESYKKQTGYEYW